MTDSRIDERSLGKPLILLDHTNSTMLDVQRLRSDGPEGLMVVAKHQSAGRGRADHTWVSPDAGALLCSMLLRPQCSLATFSLFSLAVGLALAEAIESVIDRTIALKWPNDLLLDGNKVGGVLVTTTIAGDQVVEAILGFGINSGDTPPGIAGATSLGLSDAGRNRLIDAAAEQITQRYNDMLSGRHEMLVRVWTDKAVWVGEIVEIRVDGETIRGRFLGVDQTGRLKLSVGGGEERCVSTLDEMVGGPRPLNGSDALDP